MRIKVKNEINGTYIMKKKTILRKQNGTYIHFKELIRSYMDVKKQIKSLGKNHIQKTC